MKKPTAALVLILSFAGACSAAPSPVEQESRAIFYRFGEGYAVAAIDLASASSIKTSKADGDAVSKEFQGAGVQVSWLESPSLPGKPTPTRLRVSRRGHLVSDIYIGTSDPALILKRLGVPDESGANWMAYRGLAEICSDKFTFKFAGGKLSEVEWAWCAD